MVLNPRHGIVLNPQYGIVLNPQHGDEQKTRHVHLLHWFWGLQERQFDVEFGDLKRAE